MLGRFIWDELLRPIFGTMTKSTHPDQMPQYATSDQGLHFLLIEISIRNEIKLKKEMD